MFYLKGFPILRFALVTLAILALTGSACQQRQQAGTGASPTPEETAEEESPAADGEKIDACTIVAKGELEAAIGGTLGAGAASENTAEDVAGECAFEVTWKPEDGPAGSLTIAIFNKSGNVAAAKLTAGETEAVAVGDEAIWAKNTSTLYADTNGKGVVVLTTGLQGASDADEAQRLAKERAVKIGTLVVAKL